MSRRNIFSKENTFWAFLGQVMDADDGCKEVLRKKLSEQPLTDIFQHTTAQGDKTTKTDLLRNPVS